MSVQVWVTPLVSSMINVFVLFFLLVVVPAESGGPFAAPGGQQEPDPGAGPDTDGWRRPGRADTAQAGRLQHPVGRADGQGKARRTLVLELLQVGLGLQTT